MSYTKTVREDVENLLELGHPIEKIADITKYDIEFIESIEEDIANGIG